MSVNSDAGFGKVSVSDNSQLSVSDNSKTSVRRRSGLSKNN